MIWRDNTGMICKYMLFAFSGFCFIFSISGCSALLPEARSHVESPWESFEYAKKSFDAIKPYTTTTSDLTTLGFTPFVTPNIKILSYLDIINRFMPNASITKEDIDKELLQCIGAKDTCHAYEISLHKVKSKRYGNVFLDLFRFKRKSHKLGWNFWALIVLKHDLVVYKIWSGQPKVDEYQYMKNPLGPFQEPAGLAKDAAVINTL
jgi:hypothetical protein